MSDSIQNEHLMIDGVVALIVELSPHLFSALKELIRANRQIESQLAVLDKKLDLLIVREIQSAYQLIEGLTHVTSEQMRERHLIEAESNLLKNISLDSSSTTAGKPNSFWSAQAYYGLSCVALLRKEETDASRFLLQAFLLCPSEGRKTFAKELYTKVFEPRCQDVIMRHSKELTNLPSYEERAHQIRSKLFWCKAKLVGTGIMAAANEVLNQQGPARNSTRLTASKLMSNTQSEKESLETELRNTPTRESIQAACNDELDARCRAIARDLLNDDTVDSDQQPGSNP